MLLYSIMSKCVDILRNTEGILPPTVGKSYCGEDVAAVWKEVANFIKSSLLLKRAVDVKGLGRFTLLEYSLAVSQTREVWIHRPVFYLDKKLADAYDIRCERLHSTDKTSVVTPNLTTIAARTGLPRHGVEDIITRSVQVFSCLCMTHNNIELKLPPVGNLFVADRVVDMQFSRDLVDELQRDIINPVILASYLPPCKKRPVPRQTILAPATVPPPYLRDVHRVHYG